MGRLMIWVFTILCLCLALTNGAWSAKRVALVIGNGGYETVASLPNPPRDAVAIANLFKAAEFDEVKIRTDLGVSQFRAELRDFARRAVDADIAVIFYAGHGIEVGGHNYLLPVDARLQFDTDVEDEAVNLDHILQQLEPVKRLKLVILDACRENPFAPRMRSVSRNRDIGRGLASPQLPSANLLIAYAAALGATAADGDGANSPFTAALLKNLTRPGLDVRLALGQTRDDVLAATHNGQEPYIYGSLGGETLALAPALATPVDQSPEAGLWQGFKIRNNSNGDARWSFEEIMSFIDLLPRAEKCGEIGMRFESELKSRGGESASFWVRGNNLSVGYCVRKNNNWFVEYYDRYLHEAYILMP